MSDRWCRPVWRPLRRSAAHIERNLAGARPRLHLPEPIPCSRSLAGARQRLHIALPGLTCLASDNVRKFSFARLSMSFFNRSPLAVGVFLR
ncbi:hypothetical protein EMIT0324P_30678 [Pseudomonas chlororaphis]